MHIMLAWHLTLATTDLQKKQRLSFDCGNTLRCRVGSVCALCLQTEKKRCAVITTETCGKEELIACYTTKKVVGGDYTTMMIQ